MIELVSSSFGPIELYRKGGKMSPEICIVEKISSDRMVRDKSLVGSQADNFHSSRKLFQESVFSNCDFLNQKFVGGDFVITLTYIIQFWQINIKFSSIFQ